MVALEAVARVAVGHEGKVALSPYEEDGLEAALAINIISLRAPIFRSR